MAFYRQSEACPKFGTSQGHGASSGAAYGASNYPRSRAVYGPARITPNMETPTDWSPWGTFVPHPYSGQHDGLRGALMRVSQADTYDASPNPWPANGVDDQPNARFDVLRLLPSTSAHPGWSLPSLAPSPAMVFQAPPIFGLQTVPIPAVGA